MRYLEGGVHCLLRDGRGNTSSETKSAEFCGTVDEDATSSSGEIRELRRRIRVVYVRTRTCSLSR